MKILANIIILLFLFIITADVNAELKRHKVTVGMFNTYSINDGNLGRPDPDLKEVWEGNPNVSGYEACNMTMHYWPRPFDLPEVEPNQDPYAKWWINYMEEAYNLTNQNGEVRLKVIVGPLYSFYLVTHGQLFNEFIADLCKWEKGSKYEGTLGGWYTTEEPMGSDHNFDPDICNEMIDDIKQVEKSLGIPHHKIYIDVAVDGLYYSNEGLLKFTRQVDVVMISASTYLWTTSVNQPVYEPNWKSIHGPMKIVRDIIYPDRDRRKEKRPEIHVVLESRDAIGHGQPTNWEMRQQIDIALRQSVIHNDPPADGIWFFWWSEIGRKAKTLEDDWNYGRKIAEAIQIQVPRSTSAEISSVGKGVDPEKTRFRFPQSISFNPYNSCIPYDLAESGNVRIDILNERGSRVKTFNMGYQAAGSLIRFGGPYWEKGNNFNGTYTFLLYLNSKFMDEVKVKVQWDITVKSSSHKIGYWSQNNVIDVQWEPQSEEIAGIEGYSILWDTSEFSYPDYNIDLPASETTAKSEPLADGNSHYFHIASMNSDGRWSQPVHLGPFFIDTTPPSNVKDVKSDSHKIGVWSKDNVIKISWNPADDATSGIRGYSILWDDLPRTLPDDKIDISVQTTMLATEPLNDGKYYFHIRSVDNAGNWSDVAEHIGPFLIDTSPPSNVKELLSDVEIGKWTNKDTINIKWQPANDNISMIAGYSVLWDTSPNSIPEESVNIDGDLLSVKSPKLESGREYYFHIRSVDKAGNWSIKTGHIGPFMIDTDPPPKIQQIFSESHISDNWSSINKAIIKWDEVKDDLSGILGYQWGISKDHKPIFNAFTDIPLIVQLDEGIQYIFIRAVDNAGNYGMHNEIVFKIDADLPELPIISSPSHPENVWYSNTSVRFEWSSLDKISGIKEYKWSWSMNKDSIPTEEILASLNSIELVALEPGVWYFNLLAIDNAGNQSKVSHYKVQIDPHAPPAPKIISDIEIGKEWSNRRDIRLIIDSIDVPSGIIGYSYLLDHNPLSIPSETITDKTGKIEFQNLSDGKWYFHCRAKNGSGIWGQTSHFEFKIDATPPEISITYPESNRWYNSLISQYYGIADDSVSGIDWGRLYYRYNDIQSLFHSDIIQGNRWIDEDEIPHLKEGSSVIQIIVYDKAGNYAVTNPSVIMVDSSISSPIVTSVTHPNQDKWYNNNDLSISWGVKESLSGIDGFSWLLDSSENTVPKEIKMTDENSINITNLQDGVFYFHIRAVDKAGNWSETSHYKIMIDKTPPTASISLTGIAVTNGNATIVGQGTVEVLLKTSEPVYNLSLKYKPAGSIMATPIELKGFGTEWKGIFDVTLHTGDGNAKFIFSAYDKANNLGDNISQGEFFVIDTLIRSDSNEVKEISCLSEPKTKVIIPSSALNQDIKFEILKSKPDFGTVATYEIIAYDSRMKQIRDIRFKKPIELSFDDKYKSLDLSVYFWDGVKWNRVQDSISSVKIDYIGRFALMNASTSEKSVMRCWAAPNPFSPIGKDSFGDKTVFHLVSDNSDFYINIYDINGRLIKRIENGNRVWDGTDDRGRFVEGGLYIFQVHLGKQVMSGTVVVLK